MRRCGGINELVDGRNYGGGVCAVAVGVVGGAREVGRRDGTAGDLRRHKLDERRAAKKARKEYPNLWKECQ